jgi:diguanylate cyclase (GGDEF)-like protein/PAS domain S-box-containing protein
MECAPAAIMVVDGGGTITFVNEGVEHLFGYTAREIIGTNLLDHMDVDWNPYAFESIGAAFQGSGMRRPMLFRVFPKDRPPVVVEVTANSQTDDPLINGVLAYIRPWDERWLLDRVLDALAGDRPLEETLQLLVEVMGAEVLQADGAVLWEPKGGRFERVVASPALSPAQAGAGAPRDTGGAPWVLAQRTGVPVEVAVAELDPPGLRADAEAAGHRWCWAFPVPGRDGVQACLVLWRQADEAMDETCRMSMQRLVRLTELVLERSRVATELRHAATHDALTGMANRARFFGALQDVLDQPPGRPADALPHLVGVLYLDLDGFKPVNDRYGHGVGDQTLRAVARRLEHAVRAGDLVARLGGDEFAVLCPDVADVVELHALARRLIEVVAAPVALGEVEVQVGVSVGVAAAAPGSCSIDTLIDAADDALMTVKRTGKGRWAEGRIP